MRLILIGLTFGLTLVGSRAAASNHLEKFSIQQCHGAVCATARGASAFVNVTGRVMFASQVTLKIRSHGHDVTHLCDSFSADLSSGRYVCDNRYGRGDSVTVDADLNLKTYR